MKVLLVSEGEHEEFGALKSLVQRAAPGIQSCEWDVVKRDDIHAHHGKGQGYFKKAVRWMREARKRGYDALVLVIDEDGDRERIRELDSAQEENQVTALFPRALGVAIRSFDAWMLADEKALTSVLGMNVPMQRAPEGIQQPKTVCADLLRQSNCGLWQREMYARIAEVANLERLAELCPRGFGVFAARLRTL